jgi:polar amino acid transport system ATP-binding protein
MPLLEVRNLKKTFGDRIVLKDVTFDLDEGEVKAVMGPSGCGKSTLLRCINRLVEPTAGSIIFRGMDVTGKDADVRALRQMIGFVFQNYALYRHLSVFDNITLALRKLKHMSIREAEAKALYELERMNVAELKNNFPTQLSGGQKQRVAIARALAMDPGVLFFDEPTSALDPIMAREVASMINRLHLERVTVLCVTHDFELARSIADRIIFLSDGRVRAEDSGDNLRNHYADQEIQAFFSQGAASA